MPSLQKHFRCSGPSSYPNFHSSASFNRRPELLTDPGQLLGPHMTKSFMLGAKEMNTQTRLGVVEGGQQQQQWPPPPLTSPSSFSRWRLQWDHKTLFSLNRKKRLKSRHHSFCFFFQFFVSEKRKEERKKGKGSLNIFSFTFWLWSRCCCGCYCCDDLLRDIQMFDINSNSCSTNKQISISY